MAVSIEDVAKRANVSISTVSRVLNRRELVNKVTLERVEKAIAELDYKPNVFARGLMLQKSEMLGLVLPDMHGGFYSEVIRGANAKARELGYNLVVSSAKDVDDAHALLEGISQRSIVDGMAVMVSEVTDRIEELLAGFRIPVTILDDFLEDTQHDSVMIDQRSGALAVMRHLVDNCGANRIFFVGGLQTNADTMVRRKAYEEVLQAAGLPYNSDDIYHLDYSYDRACELAAEHIATWAGPGHCVFAANDEMAAGILAVAQEKGIRVPSDLAIVGFDDTRVAGMTRPALTTVRVPLAQMGSIAIEVLCQRVADPKRPPTKVSLRPQLVVRDSCGAKSNGNGCQVQSDQAQTQL